MSEDGCDDDDITPPERYPPILHPTNMEPCRVLANLSMRLNEHRRTLDKLRFEISTDPRPVGAEGWHRIADAVHGSGDLLLDAARSIRDSLK